MKGWKIGGIVGVIVGLIGFTRYLLLLSYFLFPIWLPLLIFTEGLLGIELEGPCTSFFCNVPYGIFTTIYFGTIGMLSGFIIEKIIRRVRK